MKKSLKRLTRRTETVLALTNDDENNMMACVLAEKTGLKKEQSQ